MKGLFDKLRAVVRRDALDSVRHRSGFVFAAAGLGAELAGFFFLARAIGPQFRPDGMDYYPFLLIGTAMFTFLISGVQGFVTAVQEAQMTGTMEVVMTTATPPPIIVCLSAFSAFAGRSIRMVVYIAVGALFYSGVFHPNWPAVIAVIALSIALAISIGMLAASAQVWVQKGNAVLWMIGLFGWLLTGTAFPISSLPGVLQKVAAIVPVTYSIRGLRAALLPAASGAFMQPIAVLAFYVAILLPLSILLFSAVIRRARMEGTLSYY